MSQNSKDSLYRLYRNLPDISPALALLFEKVEQTPEDPRIHFELGETAYRFGMLQLACDSFLTVTELAPNVEVGFFNLGNVYFDLKDFVQARKAYEQAFALNPDSGTLNNLGNSYAALRDWENAVDVFDRALSMSHGRSEEVYRTWSNRGQALMAQEKWREGAENFHQAILAFPGDIQFLSLRATCHQHACEFSEAIKCLMEAIEANPNHPDLLFQIADLNFERGRAMESVLCLNQVFTTQSAHPAQRSLRLKMLAFCDPVSPKDLLEEASCWGDSLAASASDSSTTFAAPVVGTPRRFGLICGELNQRGIGGWLPSLLKRIEIAQNQWHIFCDQAVDSEVMSKLLSIGCKLTETAMLNHQELASLIQANRLDFLIEMIGHGRDSRLQVIAKKPAPIQVSWNAFPVTSGLKQLDFIWSDPLSLPPDSEQWFTEAVVRWPQSSLCYQPFESVELESPMTKNSPWVCGFLGQPKQLSPSMFEMMSLILETIPDSILVFVGAEYRDREFQKELQQKIGDTLRTPNRIQFQTPATVVDEFHGYQMLDVSLDPFPVGSPQRAFESLWMGVPVVTKLGTRFSERQTASILHALDHHDWIALNPNEYLQTIQRMADNRETLRSQRSQVRSELLSSSMCNLDLVASNFQAAFEQTWQRALNQRG